MNLEFCDIIQSLNTIFRVEIMYVEPMNIFMFIILPIFALIGMVSMYRQQSKEWYHKYSVEKDTCNELRKELNSYKEKDFFEMR